MTFFSASSLLSDDPAPKLVPRCGSCGLGGGCTTPKMTPTGEGQRRVLVVAEAPGKTEDEEGIQLIGRAGQRLRSDMDDLGWDLNWDCWKRTKLL